MTTKTNAPKEVTPVAGRWVSYRPEIKIVDCTIRDGGLMNNHKFSDEVFLAVYQACVDGGIDYMEVGYKGSRAIFSDQEHGTWKFSAEDDLRRLIGDNDTDLNISVMADAERTDYHRDIVPHEESVIDLIRVATYVHQIPVALDMIRDAHEKGYETSVNLMAVSTVQEWELDEALNLLAQSEVDSLYVVDSFGSLYSEQVHYLVHKYLQYAKSTGKQVGMHAHNNQQLAFANTVEAIVKGANMVDGSMAGLGRGAGNCPTESLLCFLHNPKYRLRPVLKCMRDYIEPMRERLRWGFDVPYMLTGMLNRHPRTAMAFNTSDDQGDYVKFFDMVTEGE